VTAVTRPTTKNRTLVWAAAVGAVWTALLIASAVGCATGLTRADNLVALTMSVACVALIGGAAFRGGDGLRRVAQFTAGLLGGMYFGPSTGAILSIVAVGLGLSDALRARRPLGILLVVAGFGLGLLMTYGVLMRFLAPTDIRC
jgi:hypothetical protein